MTHVLPPPGQPPLVLPLVRSILAEMRERRTRARLLESAADLVPQTSTARRRQEIMLAESRMHRRELRRALRELEKLDCYLLSLEPPLVAIQTRCGHELRRLIWQP